MAASPKLDLLNAPRLKPVCCRTINCGKKCETKWNPLLPEIDNINSYQGVGNNSMPGIPEPEVKYRLDYLFVTDETVQRLGESTIYYNLEEAKERGKQLLDQFYITEVNVLIWKKEHPVWSVFTSIIDLTDSQI